MQAEARVRQFEVEKLGAMVKGLTVQTLKTPDTASGEKYPRNLYFNITKDPACVIVLQKEDNHEVDKWNWSKVTDIRVTPTAANSKDCFEYTVEVRSSTVWFSIVLSSSSIVGYREVHVQDKPSRGPHDRQHFFAIPKKVQRGDTTGRNAG
jgi:hypothetical protein